MRRIGLSSLMAIGALLAAGRAPIAQGAPEQQAAQTQRVTAGPITATLTLDRASMTAAESLVARLEVSAPSGVRVELPTAEGKLGEFTVVSVVDEPELAKAGPKGMESTVVRRYTLEPFLPGDYTLPALEIRWRRKDPSASGVARTAAVTVPVRSLLAPAKPGENKEPAALDPGTIRDAYSPPATNERSAFWTGIAIGAGGVATVVAGGVWARRRRGSASDPVKAQIERVSKLRGGGFEPARAADVCHELAGAVRMALADRIDPAAAVLPTEELAGRFSAAGGSIPGVAGDGAALLKRLDAARFSGEAVSGRELESLIENGSSVLVSLLAMPSVGRKGGAA